MLVAARLVLGFVVGSASFVSPEYISEQAPKRIRAGSRASTKVGRRKLLLTGTGICVASLTVLGIYFASAAVRHSVSWLALVCLVVYIAGFAIGLGPVVWLMISEVFPARVRFPAMATSVANWGSNFLISATFLSVVAVISRAGTYWVYAGLGLVAFVVFLKWVPETKGKTLEEIERDVSANQGPRAQQEPAPASG